MGLFSSFFSFSRSSGKRKRSHRGSSHYKRRKTPLGSILSSIFSGSSYSKSSRHRRKKSYSSSWWS